MPLSEHEQQMLDDLERRLSAEDPRFARTFDDAARPRRDRRRIVLGVVVVLVGLGLLVLSVSLPAVWLGVLAFLVMLGGAAAAVTAPVRRSEDSGEQQSAPGPRPASPSGGNDFLRRMEQRWERRSGEDPRA